VLAVREDRRGQMIGGEFREQVRATYIFCFYEMESSSPAKVLASRAFVDHVHRTIHIVGTEKRLDVIARAALGVSLDQVQMPER
jgi:hypothetical protein